MIPCTSAQFHKILLMTASFSPYLYHQKPHTGLSYTRFRFFGPTKNNRVVSINTHETLDLQKTISPNYG